MTNTHASIKGQLWNQTELQLQLPRLSQEKFIMWNSFLIYDDLFDLARFRIREPIRSAEIQIIDELDLYPRP